MKTLARHRPNLSICVTALLAAMLVTLLSQAPLHALQAAESQPSEAALIESMQARLPELMQLKLAGKVGESNMGLVEGREVLERDARRLISEENRDRLAHYKIIADKLGVPVAAVQRKRAEQIRENSPRGIWIESKTGSWYRD
jgi:uncharacterized protein YdbL (DUF1318 family)